MKRLSLMMVVAGLISCIRFMAQSNDPVQTFPDWVSNYPGDSFIRGPNGKYILNTNVESYWRGVWKEDANGLRVQLRIATDPAAVSWIDLGSVITNSGPGYFKTPNGKFSKFELKDSSGSVIPPKPSAGTNLLGWHYYRLFYRTNPPTWAAPTGGSLEENFPEITSIEAYPRDEVGGTAGEIYFTANKRPEQMSKFKLGDFYSITNEGDYTLTICPVLYRRHPVETLTLSAEQLKELLILNKGNHNITYYNSEGVYYVHTNAIDTNLHRVDLPCVTTKIHLIPNAK